MLPSIVVCHAATAIRDIVFRCMATAMARNVAMATAMAAALEEEGDAEGRTSYGNGNK